MTSESAMDVLLRPSCLLFAAFSERVRQEQENVIEYRHFENRDSMEKCGIRRISKAM